MILSSASFGASGPYVVCVHGLLGSKRHFTRMAEALSNTCRVITLDMRNHGESGHVDEISLALMTADVRETLAALGIERAHLIGHSLGGKLMMRLACESPQLVESLTVIDIAPKVYSCHFARELGALAALDFSKLANKAAADDALKVLVPDWKWRRFLLNTIGEKDGQLFWRTNVPAIHHYLKDTSGNALTSAMTYEGPVCFWSGSKSDFIQIEDKTAILTHFPQAKIDVLEGFSHNPHLEDAHFCAEKWGAFYDHLNG